MINNVDDDIQQCNWEIWPTCLLINKRKRICKIVDFAVSADHRINLKESEKKDKYLAREFKKKTVENESNDGANCDWCIRHSN